MAAESRTILKSYFETADAPTQAQFADLIDSFYSSISDYGIYFGTLSQSGTDAPVATVMFNTLGYVPTFTYTGVGSYQIVSVGNLDVAKTFIYVGVSEGMVYTPLVYSDSSPDAYTIETLNAAQSNTNGLMDFSPILILQIP